MSKAIILIEALALVFLVAVYFGANAPPGPQPGTSSTSVRTGVATHTSTRSNITTDAPVSVLVLYNAYASNPGLASQTYGAKTLLVGGPVSSTEHDQSGNYGSCTQVVSSNVNIIGGCLGGSGYVVWSWSKSAAPMPVGAPQAVARCTVMGMRGGNLILSGCISH